MPTKRWQFEYPTEPPSEFTKLKMEVVRATNNFQRGFDGQLTPLQLGVLKPTRPLRKYEILLQELFHKKNVFGMLKMVIMDKALANEMATRKKRLLDLNADT